MSSSGKRAGGVRMTHDEAWSFVRDAHTAIFTTLRQDGYPIALPIWFAALDERIYISTRGAKVVRSRRDPRCSFLVEAGERWAALQAVHFTCDALVLESVDEDLAQRIGAEMKRKYASFTTSGKSMPKATRKHYATSSGAMIQLVPHERFLTWDNNFLSV